MIRAQGPPVHSKYVYDDERDLECQQKNSQGDTD